ncbi:unnamed protein product [Lepeophtheirus salmonis]|uniref:Probable RNA polymerase II nuclear localization protein SLC7A6OS n=1 Tax=Lepeophtheirus salmonis TaxID=72036 RepID=A0A0K2T9Y5_LEPSM|nr:unnamed protein product [Lepeophtheirus salmonis]CAF2869814.1 unnamed protein product [Lepeophtheirus salmonis]
MASSAVSPSPDVPLLRIKRLRSNDPVEALLIHQSCKRLKVQFDYVGTRPDPEPLDIIPQSQSDVKSLTTRRSKNSKDSRRSTKNKQSSKSRYEFVSKNRGNLFCDIVKVEGQENEDTILCNGVPLEEQKEEYVYDFYRTFVHNKEFDLDYVTSVHAQDFVVEADSSNSEIDIDSDDSNDENNYRNDYPDEEDEDQYREDDSGEDCYGLITKLHIDDEFYSGDEDGNLYSRDEDESRNGLSYERYKQRITEEDND